MRKSEVMSAIGTSVATPMLSVTWDPASRPSLRRSDPHQKSHSLQEPIAPPRLIAIPQRRESAMKFTKIMIAGTAALTIVGSAAQAQQAQTGTVTRIDRVNGTVAIQQAPSGTVGAGSGGASEEFKVQSGLSLDAVHAGDRVNFSATGTGSTKTITKLNRQ
jgi:Cu/Ag efflux protein CusF